MTPLEQLEQNVFDRIDNDLSMATVTVLQEKKGITDADLMQTLGTSIVTGTKKGACILVCEPFYDIEHPGATGPMIEPQIYVRCIVRPMINNAPTGTGISVSQLELSVLQLLHNYVMQDINVTTTAHKGDPIIWSGGERERTVSIKTILKLKPLSKCAPPVIAGSSGEGVTITCATPGAVVYYTTDGSYPCPGNETAGVIQHALLNKDSGRHALLNKGGEPLLNKAHSLDFTAGATVRAVAFNQPNQVASDLAYAVIT